MVVGARSSRELGRAGIQETGMVGEEVELGLLRDLSVGGRELEMDRWDGWWLAVGDPDGD